MIHRTTAALCLAAAALMAPGAAAAQQSSAAQGEVRWVFEVLNDIVFMVQSTPPTVTPSEPVEVWVWTFYRAPKDTPRLGEHDRMAVRTRVDCRADTREGLRYEGFLGDAFVGGFDHSGWAAPSSPDTASAEIMRMACEPGYGDGLLAFPDVAVAEAAARAHFEGDYP